MIGPSWHCHLILHFPWTAVCVLEREREKETWCQCLYVYFCLNICIYGYVCEWIWTYVCMRLPMGKSFVNYIRYVLSLILSFISLAFLSLCFFSLSFFTDKQLVIIIMLISWTEDLYLALESQCKLQKRLTLKMEHFALWKQRCYCSKQRGLTLAF